MRLTFEMMMSPEQYGLIQCDHCNGYGSSLKESGATCSKCGGSGLVKKEGKENETVDTEN